MKRDLNCFELCIFWRAVFWISFYRLYLLKYKAFVGVLSSSIWVLYQGQIFLAATERENITYLYCFERAHYKVLLLLLLLSLSLSLLLLLLLLGWAWVLLLFMFSFLGYTNLTYLNSTDEEPGPVWRLNSQISQDGTFVKRLQKVHFRSTCVAHKRRCL